MKQLMAVTLYPRLCVRLRASAIPCSRFGETGSYGDR